jgi:hypothetical protein
VKPVVVGLPREIQPSAADIGGAEGKLALFFSNNRVPLGTYSFYLRAATKAKRTVNDKERDVDLELISSPIRVRVHATPIELKVKTGGPRVRRDGSVEVEIELQRRFGFDETVDITLSAPPGVSGVSAKQISLAKGASSGKLQISANGNATVGEHQFQLVGRLRFNNVPLEHKAPFALQIEKEE